MSDRVVDYHAYIGELEARIEALEAAGQFLLDRLDEFDPGDDEPEREYHGHVTPAIARFRTALAPGAGQMSERRFFIEHGVIHDRVTGKHVTTDGQPPFEDSLEQVLELLNSLTSRIEALEAALRELAHFPVTNKNRAGTQMMKIARAALAPEPEK